jgi:hypothetical protein
MPPLWPVGAWADENLCTAREQYPARARRCSRRDRWSSARPSAAPIVVAEQERPSCRSLGYVSFLSSAHRGRYNPLRMAMAQSDDSRDGPKIGSPTPHAQGPTPPRREAASFSSRRRVRRVERGQDQPSELVIPPVEGGQRDRGGRTPDDATTPTGPDEMSQEPKRQPEPARRQVEPAPVHREIEGRIPAYVRIGTRQADLRYFRVLPRVGESSPTARATGQYTATG